MIPEDAILFGSVKNSKLCNEERFFNLKNHPGGAFLKKVKKNQAKWCRKTVVTRSEIIANISTHMQQVVEISRKVSPISNM